jgi:predicted amidohydrolase
MPQTFNIALVQFFISHLQPETNIAQIEKFIQQAKEQNTQVIIFPEDCMTSSIFGDLSQLERDDIFLHQFQNLAQKYQIDIVTGSWMKETSTGAFSSSSYINSLGEVLGTYHKNHLYLSERKFLSPGTEVSVFDTAYGKAGIIICWDIMFPEIFDRMKQLGVQIVYCPSYWYKEVAGEGLKYNSECEEQHLDALCLARAVENNIVFIYANAAGVMTFPNGSTDTLVGHSQIAVPIAGTLAKMNHNNEEMLIQKVDMSFLEIAGRAYKLGL